MAKTTAPLLSFGGAGQIGKSMVFSKWKGIGYARRYVIPANPNSTGQQATRNVFSYSSAFIKLATASVVEVWTAYAKGKPLTVRNAFMGLNIKALRGQANNDAMVLSNGANGGIAAAGIATGVVSDTITVTLAAPALPTGWAIVEGVAVATLQQDPESYTDATSYEATDNSDPYAPAITVPASGTYVIAGWFKFAKDGVGGTDYAYGPALLTTAVVA